MPGLSDIIDLLKRWDRWKRIDETPERVDALEQRIAELESKLERAPGQACPACGAWEFRVLDVAVSHAGLYEVRRYTRRCQVCGFEDTELGGST